jgi:phage host-nuclease inhibitor protein Gam
MPTKHQLLTLTQAAARAHVSVSDLTAAIRAGDLRRTRLRLKCCDVDSWAEASRVLHLGGGVSTGITP